MHLHPCPGRGCPAGFVTSRELRESVATYVLLRSGEHERVKERNPSKASAKAPAFIYSGVILLYRLKNALLRVPVSGCERTSACVHRFTSREYNIYYAQRTFTARVII